MEDNFDFFSVPVVEETWKCDDLKAKQQQLYKICY